MIIDWELVFIFFVTLFAGIGIIVVVEWIIKQISKLLK